MVGEFEPDCGEVAGSEDVEPAVGLLDTPKGVLDQTPGAGSIVGLVALLGLEHRRDRLEVAVLAERAPAEFAHRPVRGGRGGQVARCQLGLADMRIEVDLAEQRIGLVETRMARSP